MARHPANMSAKRRRTYTQLRKKLGFLRSVCAELQFPVSRVGRLLRERHGVKRLSPSSPVFLAGVLEYLTSNILELAGEEACSNQQTCITPQHVEQVVDGNEHLGRLFDKNAFSEVDGVPQPTEM